MTLEQQVTNLVTATTALTSVVNTELNNVRQENTNFKNGIVDSQGQGVFNGVKIGRGPGNYETNLSVVAPGSNLTTGQINTIIGSSVGGGITDGWHNTIIGCQTGNGYNGGSNTIIGSHNYLLATSVVYSVSIGFNSQCFGEISDGNTSIGANSLKHNKIGTQNTAVGQNALFGDLNIINSTGVGYSSSVTGNNQVQLGNSSTTTYVFGTVQNRSDIRDKTDVRNTILGLDFIKSLRPVDYRWDMREDYKPVAPQDPGMEATDEQKASYQAEIKTWLDACKLKNITHNGTKKRNRFHHGLIAQEVKEVLTQKGIDFGGYQDHSISGGDDVLSLGYDQFIAPLIKAVQELSTQNEALIIRISVLESNLK
jgi:Chaperone of endosialidase